MPNLSLLSILAVMTAVFYTAYSLIPIMNNRGDEALSGVVKGVRVSVETRRLMLFTHYMPLCAFLATFALIAGLGIFELARGLEEPRVQAVGYMVAVISISGAAVIIGLGAAWFLHTWAVLREAEAD